MRDIIKISLSPLGLWSKSAEELLLMTAAHESLLGKYNKQISGPALGIYQMEPSTLQDGYNNFISDNLNDRIVSITGISGPSLPALQYNPLYSTIHARIKYLRDPRPLPLHTDISSMSWYAKVVYNSRLGAATTHDYYTAYQDLVVNWTS